MYNPKLKVSSFNLEFWRGLSKAEFKKQWKKHGFIDKFPDEKLDHWYKLIKDEQKNDE